MVTKGPKETLDAVGLGRTKQKRSIRVADAIKNELAILFLQKVRDPKIGKVIISRVEVTDDLKYARIYYTVHGDESAAKETDKGLQRAKGFFRSHLAETLNMRYTPELQFRYDKTEEKVAEIERLFQEIAGERDKDENNPRGTQQNDQ
jgi:ribosome-binding factor A